MGRRIVIVGATSAIAQQCARIWSSEALDEFVLLGRDPAKLERVALDLCARQSELKVTQIVLDFLDPIQIAAVADDISTKGAIDIVLIAHGDLPSQHLCEADLVACQKALEVNGLSPVLFAEAFIRHMVPAQQGTIAIIGSVAGDRGRRSNYVYGSAKSLVARYAEGLQHRLVGSHVRVVLIKPGPTDTPMTAHLKENGARLAALDTVAQQIVTAIRKQKPLVYVPKIWWAIMIIIRHIPRTIFNKLNI